MKQKHQKKPEQQREIASERIALLFVQADAIYNADPALSNRYAKLASTISKRFKVRLPPMLKRRVCRHCGAFLKQPHNCRIRLHEGKLVCTCLQCKGIMRYPYMREQKQKRKLAALKKLLADSPSRE